MAGLIEKFIETTGWLLCRLGGFILLGIAMLICVDVFFRNMGRPLVGSMEIVEILFVAACFSGFAYTHLSGREIRVDVVRLQLQGRRAAALELLSASLTCALFALLTYYSVSRGMRAVAAGEFMDGRLLLPVAIPWTAMAIGSVLMTIATLRTIVINLRRAFRSQEEPHARS